MPVPVRLASNRASSVSAPANRTETWAGQKPARSKVHSPSAVVAKAIDRNLLGQSRVATVSSPARNSRRRHHMFGRTQARSASNLVPSDRIPIAPGGGSNTDVNDLGAAYGLRAFWSFPVTVRVIARILA